MYKMTISVIPLLFLVTDNFLAILPVIWPKWRLQSASKPTYLSSQMAVLVTEEVRKCHPHTCVHSGCGSPRWPWWRSDRGDRRSHQQWDTPKALLHWTSANCTLGERPPSRPLHSSEVVWVTTGFLSLYSITLMPQLPKSVNHLPMAIPLFFLTL